MANNIDIKNLLIGKKAIIDYLSLSEELYDKFRREGITIKGKKYIMPILIVDRKHYATKTRLDEYWNFVCMCDSSKEQDDEEESEK